MFERFADRARRVVVLAQEEARLLNHDHIGTEHILLGLIHEGDGVAAAALESLGLSLDDVRTRVEQITGVGARSPSGHIAFTARAKKVLELSLREALQLGHNYIGTEHVLLGIVHEGQGVAVQVLAEMGVELDRVRQEVLEVLAELGESEGDEGVTRIVVGGHAYEPEVVRGRQTQVRIVQRLLADAVGPLPEALRAHDVDPEEFLVTLDRLIREDAGGDALVVVRQLLHDGSSRLARALSELGVDAEEVWATIDGMADDEPRPDDDVDDVDDDVARPDD